VHEPAIDVIGLKKRRSSILDIDIENEENPIY